MVGRCKKAKRCVVRSIICSYSADASDIVCKIDYSILYIGCIIVAPVVQLITSKHSDVGT